MSPSALSFTVAPLTRAVSVSAVLHCGEERPGGPGGAGRGAAGRPQHVLAAAELPGGAAHSPAVPGGGHHRQTAAQ